MVVVGSREGDGSSCIFEKMEVVGIKSCLQRLKDVIFEGYVREFGYGVSGRRKKMKKKKEE